MSLLVELKKLVKIIVVIFLIAITWFMFLYIKGIGEADKIGCKMFYEETMNDSYLGIVNGVGDKDEYNSSTLDISTNDGRNVHYSPQWEKHKQLREFIWVGDSVSKVKIELIFSITKIDGRKGKFKIPIKECK